MLKLNVSAGNRTLASVVEGEHSSKELLELHIRNIYNNMIARQSKIPQPFVCLLIDVDPDLDPVRSCSFLAGRIRIRSNLSGYKPRLFDALSRVVQKMSYFIS